MKNRNYIFLLTFLTILSISCDDALEVDNHSTIPVEGFPANLSEAEALLYGSYDKIRDFSNSTVYTEERSDAFEVGIIGGPSNEFSQNLFPGNAPTWTSYYSALQNINILIKAMPELGITDARATNILAQAYFLRAYTFFYLSKIWGDVPLVLQPTTSPDDQRLPRAPIKDVFQQINADIQQAIDLFTSDGISDKYLASKPAAYALLSDVKMYSAKVLGGGETDFRAAIQAIEFVEASGVSLLADFGAVFDTKENQEIIFALFLDHQEQKDMYARLVSAKEADIGTANLALNPKLPISVGNTSRHVYTPSARIRGLFTNPNDKRTARSFLPILVGSASSPTIRSYHQTKFYGTVFNAERQYDDDVIVYRLADLLLLKAEAYAALEEAANALIPLNKVRNRAGTGDYTGPTDKSTLEKEILDERGRELFLELKRWNDLVRFHNGGTIDIYSYVPSFAGKDTPLYWPISETVIVLNNLIDQTKGY